MFSPEFLAALSIALYAMLCYVCLRRPVADRVYTRAAKTACAPTQDNSKTRVLVAYASQSGTAESLARQQALELSRSCSVNVCSLNQLCSDGLMAATTLYQHILFVVSTYGDGEPPDNALRFTRNYLSGKSSESARIDLSPISFAVLALGDRQYQKFCAFGHQLYEWMQFRGATPLFETVCVDQGCADSLGLWRTSVDSCHTLNKKPDAASTIVMAAERDKGESDRPGQWEILGHHLLNRDSPGAPLYHLKLMPYDAEGSDFPRWKAGDIAEIEIAEIEIAEIEIGNSLPGNKKFREYSIASIPECGTLDLVVRQLIKDDGSLGTGSGWLTTELGAGSIVRLKIRNNPSFHAPDPGRPMILIGAGSGIAGLRSHLLARESVNANQNWLIFGERCPRSDAFFSQQITRWHRSGHLQQLSLAFSKAHSKKAYVQDLMRESADEIRRWVERGAAIYICGSLYGMAASVENTLAEILGDESVQVLKENSLYRRDVY
ncbi:MAG: sulfite reductase subunit alpha [Pseudohongiella sp.]|nr:sulfite reductase subunit alpha [Pseudohongiella sp.]